MNATDNRADNRAAFPDLATVADQLRANGYTVRLLWAERDDGLTLGRRPEPDGDLVLDARGFLAPVR